MASKELEAGFLDAFLASRPELRVAGLSPSEAPDFVADHEGGRLGVELTQFRSRYHASARPPEEQDSLRARALSMARRHYSEKGGNPLQVRTMFSNGVVLTKNGLPDLAARIATKLLEHSSSGGLWHTVEYGVDPDLAGIPEVSGISSWRVPSEASGVWYPSRGGWVRHATFEEILDTVGSKESRLGRYREHCTELWLVIVFLPVGNESYTQPPSNSWSSPIETGFDRVFCLDVFGPRSLEIQVIGNHR